MSEQLEQGKFQGMVLERLDGLKAMGIDIKRCLEDHERRLQEAERELAKIKILAVTFGSMAGLIMSFVAKYVFK